MHRPYFVGQVEHCSLRASGHWPDEPGVPSSSQSPGARDLLVSFGRAKVVHGSGVPSVPEEATKSIQHPQHPVPEDVRRAFDRLRQKHLDAAAGHFALVKAMRPTRAARAQRVELVENAARSLGIDVAKYRSRTDDFLKRLEESDRISAEPSNPELEPPTLDFNAPVPTARDHYFWLSHGESAGQEPYVVDLVPGQGFRVSGRHNHDDGSTIYRTFWVSGLFELHWERIPHSASGYWRSDPYVHLLGGLLGYTADGTIFSGDRWSNAWMARRQALLQHPPSGPYVLGEAVDRPQIIAIQTSLADDGVLRTYHAPGHQPMPSLTISRPIPGLSIWAAVEVRIDIQLEGDSGMWTGIGHPVHEFWVRHAQWPLIPI